MASADNTANLSLTINDLSIGDGLLGVSCSDLLSSPDTSTNQGDFDHNLCSCLGDNDDEICKNKNCPLSAPTTPNIEVSRAGGEGIIVSNSNEISDCIVSNGDPNRNHTETVFNIDDIHSPTLPEIRKQEDEGIMTLFNDTSATLSRFLNRDNSFQNKMNDTSLSASYRLSFADSTQFYSLAAGNIQDCLDEEDDDTAIEDNDNEEDPVLSMNGKSLISINTSQRNVTFRSKSIVAQQNEHNEFLNSNGDVNADKFHEQAMGVEENILKRDKMLKTVVEALELTYKEKEEIEAANQALKDQISELQAIVNKQSEDAETERKRENLSPTTETFSSHSELPNSEVEDLKLQVANLEKKLEVERKYLEGQTAERELERDDFQRTITDLTAKIEDMKKEKERFDILISNQKTEIEDLEVRLRDTMEIQNEAVCRNDKIEEELKSAVEKIHELREIIRDLEDQIDGATKNVCDLKEENQLLNEERLRLESLKTKADEMIQTTEEIGIGNPDLTDELHAQVEDLTRRLERKLNDMDNFQWSTRPNSSCSNAVSVSNEDISVGRDLGYMNRDKDCVPQDIITLLSDGLRKLDAQFESLVRFEEIIMKKLRDSELRLCNTNKIQEDLENEKHALHDKIKSQIMKISDLENRLDQFRFEPSPNAVTLSGLRARVTSLSNEVSEFKGQLHLKEIEMQDLSNKLASKEALVLKLSMKPPQEKLKPPVKKYSVAMQTHNIEPEPSIMNKNKQSAFTQTIENTNEAVFKVPKTSKNIAVQTDVAYILEAESLEISRIPGLGPVTHSTPNDPISLLKLSSRNLRQKSKLSEEDKTSKGNFADPFEVDLDRSPEVLRDPSESRLNHSFASDKIPRIPDLHDYEPVPKPYVQSESDYGGGSGNGIGGIASRFKKIQDVGERSIGTTAGDYENNSGFSSSNSDPTAVEKNNMGIMKRGGNRGQGEDGEDDGLSVRPSEQSLSSGTGGAGVAGQATETQKKPTKNCFGMDLKLLRQVKRFLEELKNNQSIARNLSKEHYNLLQQVMQFLVDKDRKCGEGSPNGCSSDGECTHSYEVVTVTDFAWDNEGQQLNVINTQGKIVPVDGDKSTRGRIGSGRSVIRVGDISLQVPADQQGGNEALVDRGTDPEAAPVDTSNVDWNTMEKSKQGRQTETASKVELETIKTQMTMLQQALNQEKEKNCVLQGDLERLSQKQTGSGDLCGRVEEYKYENDQQRMEINRLRTQIQALGSQNPGAGIMGYDPNVRQQQHTPALDIASISAYENMTMTPECLRLNDRERVGSCLQQDSPAPAVDILSRPLLKPEDTPFTVISRYGASGSEKETSKPHNQRWFELYLRAKSYRKALAWQKKYLAIVIQGYKDLLGTSGSAFEHPDLLQKQVPLTPSSVGLCDRRKGKTRFRIVGKAVLASIRMKYMVNRWKGKICPKSAPDIHAALPYSGSSRNASASSSSSSDTEPSDNPRQTNLRKVKFIPASPPTKETSKKASRSAPQRVVKSVDVSTQNNSQPSGIQQKRRYRVVALTQTEVEQQKLLMGEGADCSTDPVKLVVDPTQKSKSGNTKNDVYEGLLAKSSQLSQYFERFHSLEKEIGNTLLRGAQVTQAHALVSNNNPKNDVKK